MRSAWIGALCPARLLAFGAALLGLLTALNLALHRSELTAAPLLHCERAGLRGHARTTWDVRGAARGTVRDEPGTDKQRDEPISSDLGRVARPSRRRLQTVLDCSREGPGTALRLDTSL